MLLHVDQAAIISNYRSGKDGCEVQTTTAHVEYSQVAGITDTLIWVRLILIIYLFGHRSQRFPNYSTGTKKTIDLA